MRQEAEPILAPEPVVVEEHEIASIGSYYKLFMSVDPPTYNGRDEEDKAESWLVEIEKAFDVIELA